MKKAVHPKDPPPFHLLAKKRFECMMRGERTTSAVAMKLAKLTSEADELAIRPGCLPAALEHEQGPAEPELEREEEPLEEFLLDAYRRLWNMLRTLPVKSKRLQPRRPGQSSRSTLCEALISVDSRSRARSRSSSRSGSQSSRSRSSYSPEANLQRVA